MHRSASVLRRWQVRDLENVLLIRFEQMKADQPAVIRQVAEFMGVELSPKVFALVDEKSHFSYMKKIGHKFDPPPILPWSSPTRMLRKRESGASSELLTAQQQRQVDDFCRSVLHELGSDFPYDELYGNSPPLV